jgi:hypothetical protein
MPVTPIVFLEIDDNTPANEPPFTNDVSVWDFSEDLNLQTRTGTEVFRKLHLAVNKSVFRGYPKRAASATRKTFGDLVESAEVTWITADELPADRTWLPSGNSSVEHSIQMLFETFDTAARHFGPNRVRLVFAFI